MNKEINSYVDFEAPTDVISIALNGLLKMDGPITAVRSDYSINVKNEIAKKQDSEIKVLHQYFFRYIETMDISLSEIDGGKTRMNFSIRKGSYKGMMIGMIFCQLLFALLAGGVAAALAETMSSIAAFFIAFVVAGVIFVFLPICAVMGYSDNTYQKRFTKEFLPRIISYVEIVKRNKKM